ncbi:MAG: RNA polymerase sigma factor [Bacteroidia bacterium]
MEVMIQMEEVNRHHQSAEQIDEEMALVLAAQQDPRCFAPLYNAYYKRIVKYVHHRVDEKETAFEITAQVFYKALDQLHRFRAKGVPFGAWLFRIAYAELQQWYRKKNRASFVRIDADGFNELKEEIDEQYSTVHDERLYEALQQLDEEEMEIINLRFFEKRSFAEISEITGHGESACKMRVYRATDKMKKHFKKD